jgi:hypothetical protein
MDAVSKRTWLFSVAILVAVGTGTWIISGWVESRKEESALEGYLQEIMPMLNLATGSDFHKRIDRVRAFINDHSIHRMDKEFWATGPHLSAYAAKLIAYARGVSREPVHMECSARSKLMARILRSMGYETRLVAIYNTDTNLQSHTFLEVFNPETQRWETQDPDYDIYWRNKTSGERISLAEAAEVIDNIEPCGRSDCGWSIESREGIKPRKLRDYLDIISIIVLPPVNAHSWRWREIRFALYTSRANLSRTFQWQGRTGTFCDVEAYLCQQGFYDLSRFSYYARLPPQTIRSIFEGGAAYGNQPGDQQSSQHQTGPIDVSPENASRNG